MINYIIVTLLSCPAIFTILGFIITAIKQKGDTQAILTLVKTYQNSFNSYETEKMLLLRQAKLLTQETRELMELLKRQRELHPEDFPDN